MTAGTATRISATSDKHGEDFTKLLDVQRKLAQYSALTVYAATSWQAITDSSTGTNSGIAAVVLPATSGSSGTMAQKTAFDTALGKNANAVAVLAGVINPMLTKLGANTLTDSTGGTIAVAGTIPAQDKTCTAAAAGAAVPWESARNRLSIARNNVATLARAVNEIINGVGSTTLPDSSGGNASTTGTLSPITATGTAVQGDGSNGAAALKTQVDAALLALANAIATIAAKVTALDALTAGNLTVIAVA